MKASVYYQYGSPEELQLKELEKPVPKHNEVLVKVKAASVNSWDWDLLTGRPLIYRLLFGLFKPKYKIIGSDIAGVVEATGEKVSRLKVGDEVFGDISGCGFGAFAEYAAASEDVLTLKPENLTFEEASAIPQAAVLALQGLRLGMIEKGKKVLINGAGGGVGTFAIQLAKLQGAEVTAVDSSEKMQLMQSLGADFVLDYQKENYTKSGKAYDLILDVVAHRSIPEYLKVLNEGGYLILVGGALSLIAKALLFGKKAGRKENKNIDVLMHKPDIKDLEYLKELLNTGKIRPVIDKRYPLSNTADAIRYLGEGHAQGKVIITV